MAHNFIADKATLDAVKADTTDIRTVVNAIPTGDRHGKAVFTADGTFTVPVGISWIYISACASGANGVYGNYNGGSGALGGDGGSCGEFFESWVPVTPGMSIPIVVGVGNTVVGDTVLLKGGGKYKGGLGGTGDWVSDHLGEHLRSGGGGGGASGPFDKYPGDGLDGGTLTGGIAGGALGNLSNGRPIGCSGLKGVDGASGSWEGGYILSGGPGGGGGCGYGAGGGGGGGSSASAGTPGGAGAPGVVIIEW